MFNKKYFPYLLLVILLALLIGQDLQNRWMVIVFKPLICLSLLLYLFGNTDRKDFLMYRWLYGGLIFSLMGDVFLIFQDGNSVFFILGLLSFLIAHLMYIAFYSASSLDKTTQRHPYYYYWLSGLYIYGSGLLYILAAKLDDLFLPVCLYATVLLAMNIAALKRFGKVSSEGFYFIQTGALLFMLSDSYLAMNKFVTTLPLSGIIIMVSYTTAQFLIVEGGIRK